MSPDRRPDDPRPVPIPPVPVRPTGPQEVLRRAAVTLRDEPGEGWDEASDRVRRTVRETTRRARPLVAATGDLPDGGGFRATDRLVVSERVVVDAVRRAVAGTVGTAPVGLGLRVERGPGGDRCTGARLDLVAGYGTRLPEAGDHLRDVVRDTLDDLLGRADRAVDIHVVDVEVGDPGAWGRGGPGTGPT